ncbi:MAG: hypothetical protein RL160_1426 [Bacteroidota bacterium]|jgi:hypothetical protein
MLHSNNKSEKFTFYADKKTTLSFTEKLRKRWNAGSTRQVWIILLVFALTGSSVVVLRRLLKSNFEWAHSQWFTYSYYWIILPVYNLMLLMYGYLFGQFRFFWEFEKRFFQRLAKPFRKKTT